MYVPVVIKKNLTNIQDHRMCHELYIVNELLIKELLTEHSVSKTQV